MPDRPNLLLVTTDHQRFDCVGANGNPIVQTPVLDRVAREGVSFSRFYATNPVCMPARASLFTGRYCQNHGVRCNGIPLPETELTLPAVLSAAGWHAGSLGKIHFTPHKGRDHEAPHPLYGWDTLVLSDEPGCYPDAYVRWVRERDPSLVENVRVPLPGIEPRGPLDAYTLAAPEEFSHTAWVATATIEFVRQHAHEPFFAHAGFYAPHPPLNPPVPFDTMYDPADMPLPLRREDELDDKPAYFQHGFRQWGEVPDEEWRRVKAFFYGMCSLVDKHVGRIVACLEELDLLDNTLIAFVSDHGDMLGDHWHTAKGPTNYDGIVHVPCLLRLPRRLPAGAGFAGLVEGVDLMPTILDILGVEVPPAVKGISALPCIAGDSPWPKHDVLIEYKHPHGFSVKTLQTDEFKYWLTNANEEVLVDLKEDPDEFINRAAHLSRRSELREMRERLLRRLIQVEDDLPERISEY
jgi:arylsulfatase